MPGTFAKAVFVLPWVIWIASGCARDAADTSPASWPAQADPTGVKVLLVGIDGAGFRVIDRVIESGRAETFKRLIENGVRGPLTSQEPMFSPALWTTIATGKDRTDHGIVYFTVRPDDAEAAANRSPAQLVSSRDRRCLALWNITSAFDLRTGIIGWWATWPAETVNGYLVSDRAVQSRYDEWVGGNFQKDRTYPPELMSELRTLVKNPVRPDMDEIRSLVQLSDEETDEFLKVTKPLFGHGLSVFKFAHNSQRSYEEIALHLLVTQDQPELLSVFLVANDPICHTFWHYYEPEAFSGVDPDKARRLGRLIENYTAHNDRFLQKLLDRVDDDTVVMIVSDHGFQASGTVPEMRSVEDVPRLLETAYEKGQVAVGQSGMHHIDGVFIASGGPIRKGIRVSASITDITPTILALMGVPVAEDMAGRVLTEIVDASFWEKHPVQTVDSYEPLIERSVETAATKTVSDPEMLERLKALGYIGTGGESDRPEPER